MSYQLLSEVDKKMLKLLLSPDGKIPSHVLAEKLGLPLSTVQRRRKRLEEEYLIVSHKLNLEKFGWRRIDLLISTEGGLSSAIGNQLLERSEVIYAAKTIGEHTIDLKVETIMKENSRLLDLLEEVKAMKGVRDVVWTEVVETLGRKIPPNHVLDSM